MGPSLVVVVALVAGDLPLQGTQPNTLTTLPLPSSGCGCHRGVESQVFDAPGDSYLATPMSLSARGPLFRAALLVAHQERPELSSTCIRCHAPRGWLDGRSEPGDGSRLSPEDLESVTCDVCHRMTPGPGGVALIGDGQFTLSASTAKRAGRGNGPAGMTHQVITSTFTASSELCGSCHSLFNPLESAHDPQGNLQAGFFYEQRTYEEWADSAFASSRDQSCADCHLPKVEGFACRERRNRYPDLRRHSIVGGSSFVVRAVGLLHPELGLEEQAAKVLEWTDAMRSRAASLTITSTHARPLRAYPGEAVSLDVRLTNLTGHKLPTGYPEGRRVFLSVSLTLGGDAPITLSGYWDPLTGDLRDDPQLRTYQAKLGRVGAGATHSLAFANQFLEDTRIPPEGFVPSFADMIPIGRDYGSTPYRHFDDHRYRIALPPSVPLAMTGTITIEAHLQHTTPAYVNALLDQLPPTSTEALELAAAYETLGKVPPERITQVSLPLLVVAPPVPPDAGVNADAASAPDASTEPNNESGCSCRSSAPFDLLALFALALPCATFFRRARR